MSGRVRERGTSASPRVRRPDRDRVRAWLLSGAGFVIFGGVFAVIGGILYGVAHLGGPDCRTSTCYPGGLSGPVTNVTTSTRTPASPATGLAFARQLLADVTLPPGAGIVPPPLALQVPPDTLWNSTSVVDADRVWMVQLPATEVITFFNGHIPSGTTVGGYMLSNFGGATITRLYYPVASVPGPLAREQVVVVIDPFGPKTSIVRVDAQAEL
jgi:hypothetical protein